MLIEFRVENFLSLKDGQVFNFTTSDSPKDNDSPSHSFDGVLPNSSVLSTSMIYGANGSGKTNLFRAISFMKGMVLGKCSLEDAKPFKSNSDLEGKPIVFEIVFAHKGSQYEYGFSVLRDCIKDEWLFVHENGSTHAQNWFERPNDITDMGAWHLNDRRLAGAKREIIQKELVDNPNRLFLSVASDHNPQLKVVHDWFYTLSLFGKQSVDYSVDRIAQRMLDDQKLHDFIEGLFHAADMGVKIIKVTKLDDGFDIGFYHQTKLLDEDKDYRIDWKDISSGEKALFVIAGLWFDGLINGNTVVADIDIRFHPNLMQYLVNLFDHSNTNVGNGQLLILTHQTVLLDSSMMGRDQVWFMKKDYAGASHVYPLLDFSDRTNGTIQQGYLSGHYGAIPNTIQ